MAEGVGAPWGRMIDFRNNFLPKCFIRSGNYFSCDCLLQVLNVKNCVCVMEDKVPKVYLYFFSALKRFPPSQCFILSHVFFFFLLPVREVPRSCQSRYEQRVASRGK